MTASFWTPEKVSILKKMWAEGFIAAEISAKIGISKNAIIGKARRLGLPGRVQGDFVRRGKAYKHRLPLPPPGAWKEREKPLKGHLLKTPLPPEKEPVYKSVLEAMAELKSGTCRWPRGQPYQNSLAFCGDPVFENYPYCLRHCYHAYSNFEEIQIKKAKQAKARNAERMGAAVNAHRR